MGKENSKENRGMVSQELLMGYSFEIFASLREQDMKQILQNLKNGKTELVEVPCPVVRAGHLLIRTSVSLIPDPQITQIFADYER